MVKTINGVYSSNKKTARRQRAYERLLILKARAEKFLEEMKKKDQTSQKKTGNLVEFDYTKYEANISRMEKETQILKSKI